MCKWRDTVGKRKFREYDNTQGLLLPPSLKDWLPSGHLAYFIEEVLYSVDLSDFFNDYESREGRGAPPFSPMLLLKVLLYCYAAGVFSSRKIAKACIEDVACRYLAAQQRPDFRTFIKFRSRHLEKFQQIFAQVIQIAREAGLVKLGHVSVDGTKMKANASKHKAMSYEHMLKAEEKLSKEISELLKRAAEVDTEEDAEYGDHDGYSLPDQLAFKEGRQKAIKEAKARLEERAAKRAEEENARREKEAREKAKRDENPKAYRKEPDPKPKPKEQENFTDAESRIMLDGATKGFVQGYNCEVAVDDTNNLIVATAVGNCAADNVYLLPIIDRVEATLGAYPDKVTADAGYKSEANLIGLEARCIDGYVACGREVYDPRIGAPRGRIPSNTTYTERMERKLLTKKGRKQYKRRKTTAEPPIGWLKHILGFRQFLLRGALKVRAEFNLVCLGLNLRRMSTMLRLRSAMGLSQG